jgi:hypothetical protein
MQVSETHRIPTTIAGPMVQLGFNGGGLTRWWDSIRRPGAAVASPSGAPTHSSGEVKRLLRSGRRIGPRYTLETSPPGGALLDRGTGTSLSGSDTSATERSMISQAPLAQLVLVGRLSQPHRPQDRDDFSHHG